MADRSDRRLSRVAVPKAGFEPAPDAGRRHGEALGPRRAAGHRCPAEARPGAWRRGAEGGSSIRHAGRKQARDDGPGARPHAHPAARGRGAHALHASSLPAPSRVTTSSAAGHDSTGRCGRTVESCVSTDSTTSAPVTKPFAYRVPHHPVTQLPRIAEVVEWAARADGTRVPLARNSLSKTEKCCP